MQFLKNKVCWAIGHKVEFYDSGYEICSRCGEHGYYDSETWGNSGRMRIDLWGKNFIARRKRDAQFKKDMESINSGEPPF